MLHKLLRMSLVVSSQEACWALSDGAVTEFFLYLTQIHVPFNLETYNISLNPTAKELKARKPETYKPGLVIPQIISKISSQRDFSKQKRL